ncbi:hypothetical protein RXV94_06370 [Yeosuana sp. MJ-SS3]|jgi:hypothetical protein|uniref:DUF4177 domain-containing protein n=1 Tax=Gilvirhabdus luticola TaxID=3079858 RepID=A0ABU3U5U7_9FLAO|nr:hypothetical protein [Yeosuana sp. MJ-SS3]MDU8885778.1 hypothetical protein [Yeosuana sp. MJ-SS3]
MRKILLLIVFLFISIVEVYAQVEYKVITSVESIVSSGLGRSRIISAEAERDYTEFASEQTEEDNTRNKSKRSDIRVKDFEETKLLNFFNIGGIRFQNIASNDAVISSKINSMIEEGWELAFITSAVESDAGKDDGSGIFITRYIFKRNK